MTAHFEVYEDEAHHWSFRLRAGNNETVATGREYLTKEGAEKGCETVKRAAAEAEIRDAR